MSESTVILRHLLSTIAYRLTKSIQGVDDGFLNFTPPTNVRSPIEIIHHMSSVLNYFIAEISASPLIRPLPLNDYEEIERFFCDLKKADALLLQSDLDVNICLVLIQGPLSDILTHVGQISLLRRLFNLPIKGENFMKSKIVIGQLDREEQDLSNEQFD